MPSFVGIDHALRCPSAEQIVYGGPRPLTRGAMKWRTPSMAIKFTEKAASVAAKPAPAKAAAPTAVEQEAAQVATKDTAKKPAKKAPRKAPKSGAAAESPLLDFNGTK
ncbi:hypothetical protein [Aminobacter aminovorans]|uniref:hypothetical protein n=1 Tax=Aminobacter aminovorans TaxID=83263 RepID=UPI0028569F15|nr:hypothetical protein [Aminobacter aminovorans]MDR7224256.1 putative membrane protein [Aminobacter aminovorans]